MVGRCTRCCCRCTAKYKLLHHMRVHTGQDDDSYGCMGWGPDSNKLEVQLGGAATTVGAWAQGGWARTWQAAMHAPGNRPHRPIGHQHSGAAAATDAGAFRDPLLMPLCVAAVPAAASERHPPQQDRPRSGGSGGGAAAAEHCTQGHDLEAAGCCALQPAGAQAPAGHLPWRWGGALPPGLDALPGPLCTARRCAEGGGGRGGCWP